MYRRFRNSKILRLLLAVLLLPYLLALVYPLLHPPSTLMIADVLRLRWPERQWVPLSRMSPHLVEAVVTAEDSAFCTHWGVDFRQMEKSVHVAYKTHRPVRATSTITQQLAKNLFLWHGRSWIRKILELPLTLWIEMFWRKSWILETYLNIVEWDDGLYGAEAASRHYFGVSASALSPMQAALLATTLPNPAKRNAARPGPAQQLMSGQLASRMRFATPDLSCVR